MFRLIPTNNGSIEPSRTTLICDAVGTGKRITVGRDATSTIVLGKFLLSKFYFPY